MQATPYAADVREATWGWWLLLLVGVLSVVAGVVVLFQPGNSLAALAVIIGIFLLVDGIIEIISAFFRGTRNRGMVALFGVITAIVGVLLIRHPVAGVAFVALLIGLWLITIGVIRLVTAFDEPEHRAWHAIAGVVEIIAGVVIVSTPEIGYVTLAVLVGIGFILNGLAVAALGWGMHEVREEAEAMPPPPVSPA
jgi:uncharacterized membrane protein HdeD (DUF308 family)